MPRFLELVIHDKIYSTNPQAKIDTFKSKTVMIFAHSVRYALVLSLSISSALGSFACYEDEIGVGVSQTCAGDNCLRDDLYQIGAVFESNCRMLTYTKTTGDYCNPRLNVFPSEVSWSSGNIICQGDYPLMVRLPDDINYGECYSVDRTATSCDHGWLYNDVQVDFCCIPLVRLGNKLVLSPNRLNPFVPDRPGQESASV